ncbi:MAG: sulfatase-like hydrolase/transferase, partial [Phycisphaerae bacterium]
TTRPAPATIPPEPWQARRPAVLDYFRALAAVDDSVGRVLETLEQTGQLDDTVVIFAGDNGFFHGEHRRSDKRLAYEESIRIPLLVRGPGVARAGMTIEPMALNIDLAPTLLDLAGVPVPASMQGRSLAPLLAGQRPEWRKSFLYEYWVEKWLPGVPTMLGVRTEDLKYVRYPEIDDGDELYDLADDPHELKCRSGDPAYADRLARMKAELERLCKETGYTPSAAGPVGP